MPDPLTPAACIDELRTLLDRRTMFSVTVPIVDVRALLDRLEEPAGVTLTPQDAADLALVLRHGLDVLMDAERGPRLRALMRRLEEAYR